MAVTRAPANPITWPPQPQKTLPYRLKHVYTVKPGDSFGSIARQEGVDVWALILFNFQTTNPQEVNWYLKNQLNCTRETRDRKNYMFSGGEQIYIPTGVPPAGCTPWPNLSKWNMSAIAGYQRWILENGESYLSRNGYTRDCANFALDALVDFAKTRQLPLAFYTAKHQRFGISFNEGWSCTTLQTRQQEISLPEYNWSFTLPFDHPDYDSFASSARKWVKVSDLYDLALGNTVRITRSELRSGDLLILPPNVATLHVQVVLSPVAHIMVDGQYRKVLMILQGNTYHGKDWPGTSTGEPIALKAWDLALPSPQDKGFYYKYYMNSKGHWKEDPQAEVQLTNFQGRRWNFDMFNRAYGLATP